MGLPSLAAFMTLADVARLSCCTDRGRLCWQDGGGVRLRLASFSDLFLHMLAKARLVLSMQQALSGDLPQSKI